MMRKLLALLIIVACLFPLATATVNDYNASLVLLIHSNQTVGHPTFFNDSSSLKTPVTTIGDATTNITTKYLGNASGFFDGTGDAISIPEISQMDYGTSNFTIMMWLYPTTNTTQQFFLSDLNSGGTAVSIEIRINATGYYQFTSNVGGTNYDTFSPIKAVPGTWQQIVYSRNATNTYAYVNGASAGVKAITSGAISDPGVGQVIGRRGSYSTAYNYYVGNIDEIAIWVGAIVPITDLYPQVDEVGYYNTSGDIVPVADFSCTPTSVTIGSSIACTDLSSDTPTNWTYIWGDGNQTTTQQNPSYTYPHTGSFTINMSANNTVGISWSNKTNYITVTNVTGFTEQDIYLTGQYLVTFLVKSSTTNLPIANVTVVDSVSGQSYPSTNGTAFLTLPAGLYYINFIADGYQSKQVTYVVDQDETHTVTMVPTDTSDAPVYNVYPPKDVKFHITSFFGAPIPNANVTIQGITTSTGNWDWVVTLIGISLDEVAINGTAMTETTDSNGDVVFFMLPTVKYNITTTASGYVFPMSIIAPQATEYTLVANWNESWFASGNDTLKDVNVSVSWVKFNETHSFVNITYDDRTATTTGGTITVYRDTTGRLANATPIKTMDITGTTCSNSTLVDTPTGGSSYRVQVNATTTDQNILRTFTHYFKGSPVMLPGFTTETILWLALFIIIFTAAFAGATHSPQMAVVLCVESWIFWAIGWLDYLISWFGYGEVSVIGVLTLASFITVLWNITEGKAKGKRSS